ncbi:hypothetical protein yc1106_10161 [Curvularia clavata]|uniref:Uncharacterized protein n=1 Tax=Curvularia clavata TaxID=95742 RepID=A0A9Q8ZGB7_CURCL|nr:hypothetical protein yc1106_10161 [Curvularia clavata]
MSTITSSDLPNIITVSFFAQIEDALAQTHITLRTSFMQDITYGELWHTFRCKFDLVDSVSVMNNGFTKDTLRFRFDSTEFKIPYTLDAWTGEVVPTLEYVTNWTNIAIPVTLSAGETGIYAFITKETYIVASNVLSAVSEIRGAHSEGVRGFISTNICGKTAFVAKISEGNALITLSSGKQMHHRAKVPNAITLYSWNVTVQSWHGADDYET